MLLINTVIIIICECDVQILLNFIFCKQTYLQRLLSRKKNERREVEKIINILHCIMKVFFSAQNSKVVLMLLD